MNRILLNKNTKWILISITVAGLILLTFSAALSGVGQGNLTHCKDLAFSTSEDFVTHGPEPSDGSPIISDGDLLAINGYVCARNEDLLATFVITDDLGLDAVDVINVENYWVAFSTELDSPDSQNFFTAGDLLFTNGGVIPNQVLTYKTMDGGFPYDLGLDAVHFVGSNESIEWFVDTIGDITREEWLGNPGQLSEMLGPQNLDIWFSTEGTAGPVDAPLFLDGDLLSAVSGAIEAANSQLLSPSVPAGIPSRGVDFGLDAVTSDRTTVKDNVHFSTEILYNGEISFTDGDVLKYGSGTIAMHIGDLLSKYEPEWDMLGLDAIFASTQEEQGCISRLTHINGVGVGDISLTDGTVNPGVLGINGSSPFGGTFDFKGTLCDDVNDYRVVYRSQGSSDLWEPMKVMSSTNWTVKEDAFFPPFPDCLGNQNWSSNADGWFDGPDYRHLSSAALGGCNPDLVLTVWESELAVSGADALYELMLVVDTTGGLMSDTLRMVQLDNTDPIVQLEKTEGVCYSVSATNLTITGRMLDDYFYNYQLKLSGDGYSPYPYSKIAYYDDPIDNVIETGTTTWDNYVDLHDIALTHLGTSPISCGYSIQLIGWDRTVVGSFVFPANWASRCVGCRMASDSWSFKQ